MNYLQLDNVKCTILRHSPLKSTVILKLASGTLRSSEMSPFDRSHMKSYSHSVITLVQLFTIFVI